MRLIIHMFQINSNDSAALFTQFICVGDLVLCNDDGSEHCHDIADDASDSNLPRSSCTDGTSSIGTRYGGEAMSGM